MYMLQRLFRKDKTEQQLESELLFDLEQRIEDQRRRGMNPDEARRRAQIELGGLESLKEQCRASRRVHLIETFLQDVRYGLRMMRRNPGFSAAAILTLALGIGASTAVFSVVDSILLRPLPYPDAQRIVIPWRVTPPELSMGSPQMGTGYDEIPWGRVDFQIMAGNVKAIQNLSAFYADSFSLTGRGDPQFLDGLRASAGFFAALGVKPALGRTFTEEEDQPGHEREVVLSHGLWRDQFGASPSVLGRSIDLNGAPYTVIGIMPPGFVFPRAEEMPRSFNFPRETQLWVPLALRAGPRQPDETSDLSAVIGRLRPGSTIAQAQAEMNVYTKRRESMFPSGIANGWFNSRVVSLPWQVAGDTRRPLLLIFGAVSVVLLLACSNVAGLLLARSLARQREFSLRSALGAAQGRMLRQLMTESLLLAALGGFLGLLAASAFIRLARIFGPTGIPRLQEADIDPWVLAFAFAATLLTGLLFGLAPALSARRTALLASLKEGGPRASGGANPRSRRTILVAQVALAVVLVVAAGLLAQTFAHLLKVDPGFNAERVLTFELSLPPTKYPGEKAIVAFYQRTLPQLRAVAGVQSAALVETAPMGGGTESSSIRVPGRPSTNVNDKPFANYSIVSPGYFSTVQTPLLRGREFLESDTADSTPVVVINRAMAEKFWPGQDPLGKQVGVASLRFPLMLIVGIAADVKHLSLREEPSPEMYVPYTQKPYPSMQTMALVVRTRADVGSVTGSVRDAIHSLDADLPLAKLTTLTAIVGSSLAQPRFSMLLLGGFAALAVILAAIGIYGVISYSVSQRTQEIGIRMALGARRRGIFAMVLRQGLGLAGLGIVIGLLVALGATQLMANFLYGVRAFDPLTFVAVALFLLAVTFAACYLPARRAMTVEPTRALRSE